MQKLEELTRLVCQVAREAGAYIRKERAGFSADRVERKHAHDYVSYVDKVSERLIVDKLRQLLPEAGFITEEGTAEVMDNEQWIMDHKLTGEAPAIVNAPLSKVHSPGGGSPVWVVDPLDGTTNFIHGFAPYAVSIALMQEHSILLGVVYDVCADECFYAWQGGGAYVNDKPIHVAANGINDALLCMQLPYNSDAYKPVIERLIDRFYGQVASVRMLGSAAIALCYVAAGRLDGYVERYIGQWDYMAGALIVKEAGGRVTNYDGSDDFTQGDSIVATNGIIHDDLLAATAGGAN